MILAERNNGLALVRKSNETKDVRSLENKSLIWKKRRGSLLPKEQIFLLSKNVLLFKFLLFQ